MRKMYLKDHFAIVLVGLEVGINSDVCVCHFSSEFKVQIGTLLVILEYKSVQVQSDIHCACELIIKGFGIFLGATLTQYPSAGLRCLSRIRVLFTAGMAIITVQSQHTH